MPDDGESLVQSDNGTSDAAGFVTCGHIYKMISTATARLETPRMVKPVKGDSMASKYKEILLLGRQAFVLTDLGSCCRMGHDKQQYGK